MTNKLDAFIAGYLKNPDVKSTLLNRCAYKRGVPLGLIGYLDREFVEIPYGLTLDFGSTNQPRLFSLTLRDGNFAGEFQITEGFPNIPTRYEGEKPSLDQMARQLHETMDKMVKGTATFTDLTAVWGKTSPDAETAKLAIEFHQ